MRYTITATSFGLVCTLLACSGGGAGGIGGGSLTTSVAGSKTLESLSSSERTQWCKDVGAYYNQQITAADTQKSECASKGMSAAYSGTSSTSTDDLRAKCRSAYQDCLAKGTSGVSPTADFASSCNASKIFDSCKATVSAMDACLADSVTAIKAEYQSMDNTCESIGADAGSRVTTTQQPSSCAGLEAQCPGIKSKSTSTTTN